LRVVIKAAAGFEPANNGFANRRLQNVTHYESNDLQTAETGAYKPAYKENPKTSPKQVETDTSKLPSDLVEIVAFWPQLPEHIKAAIKALVQTHIEST